MFKQSEIGAKCGCGTPETVSKEHGERRYRVPTGYYGGMYQRASYYAAEWITLRCETCGNSRDDAFIWKWHSNGDRTFVDGIRSEHKPRRYPDIYRAILKMMPT